MAEPENDNRKGWARSSLAGSLVRILEFFGLRALLGLFLAIAFAGVFIWLAEEVFEGDTKIFDENVREAVHQIANPALTQLMLFVSFIGSFYVLFPASIIVAVIFLYVRWKRAFILFALTMIGEQILEPILKEFYHRARPEAFFDYPLPPSYSFPSGHAFAALCFFGILAWLVSARLKSTSLQVLVWSFAVILIILIGLSRVYLGVHHPSDIIAGYLTAFIWVITIASGDHWFSRRKNIPR